MIAKRPSPASTFLIEDVSWSAYEKVLEAFDDRRFPHTYVDGVLEIMTLTYEHEWTKKLLARLIENLSIELGVRITSSGSTTLKRQLKQRGLEPDESYYVANYSAVRGLKRINLNKHPPPDLVVEVDGSHKLLDRLEAYARIGVPEIWNYDSKTGLRFLKRTSATAYRSIKHSLAFPPIASVDLQRHLDLQTKLDEFDLVNTFIAWVREKVRER
jgi:Uma2 family endonuclease